MATMPADAVTPAEAASALGVSPEEIEVRVHSRNLLPHEEQPAPDDAGASSPWIDRASLDQAIRAKEEHALPADPIK
jgi:hypothetical protein